MEIESPAVGLTSGNCADFPKVVGTQAGKSLDVAWVLLLDSLRGAGIRQAPQPRRESAWSASCLNSEDP